MLLQFVTEVACPAPAQCLGCLRGFLQRRLVDPHTELEASLRVRIKSNEDWTTSTRRKGAFPGTSSSSSGWAKIQGAQGKGAAVPQWLLCRGDGPRRKFCCSCFAEALYQALASLTGLPGRHPKPGL